MNPNLSTTYVAIQTERSRLSAQAEQGWHAEEAAALTVHRSLGATLCDHAGRILMRISVRLQGTPPRTAGTRVIDVAGS